MKPPSLSALETERLILRQWRQSDLAPFAALNADSEVMEHFPNTLTPASSQELVARITACFSEWGFGLWAVELKESGRFIGYIGLTHLSFEAHFTPCVEVGWRLAREFWGRGYAGEGGRASMQDGFLRMHLPEIVSMTATTNLKSIRVMEKLGMTRNALDDFDHPKLERGHRLRRHVLYRMPLAEWQRQGQCLERSKEPGKE